MVWEGIVHDRLNNNISIYRIDVSPHCDLKPRIRHGLLWILFSAATVIGVKVMDVIIISLINYPSEIKF